MSAVAADTRVRELYGRYKHLALAAGAALVLDASTAALEEDAALLLADARAAAAGCDAHEPQLRACIDAAGELHELIVHGGDVEAARLTHKRLRREVWKVIPCEYVPCCASERHGHE